MNKILILLLLLVSVFANSEYEVVKAIHYNSNVTLFLKYTGTTDFFIKETSPIIKNLIFTIKTFSYSDFEIKIVDADRERF